ncbi:unnamed protein product [Rotaria sordida]|uniref:Carboxylesterase type B domain-containing protein n=1 Tax=Rotaria sordida TaxID=392033 RepID=A0A818M1G9_9BILA|nr:unnamed protein product [Rotaria sordida]CAF3585292.1 unnamed protein product [Rotaria sordida]
MNNVIIRYLFYFFILLFHSNKIYSSSSIILYPSFQRIFDQLLYNSTLPQCTELICNQTETQANFSHIKLSNENLLNLSLYNKLNKKNNGPYLITSTGIYRGRRLEYHNRYIDQFLGIYYGELPETLKKPIKKRFNYSIQNATKFSPSCMQSLSMTKNLSYGSFVMQHDFNENCLSLNIYRADIRYGEKPKAIMLFSHGGSNQLGSGSLFDGSILASEGDIIVITMNFRLNYHGFLSSGDGRVKGNYGLWDQLLAVEWIYENAHLFGGDRDRIVLTGHSAGAGNVMLIPASHHSRGMIRRVISQSGTGLAPWSINHNPMKTLKRFSEDYCCKRSNENEMINCIYNLLEKSDRDIYHLHISLNIADDNPYPVIDNDFINDTIENILKSDIYKNIDFLTGVTLNEGLYFAEYHIKNFYNERQNPSYLINRSSLNKKCPNIYSNLTTIKPSSIVFKGNPTIQIESNNNEKDNLMSIERRIDIEQASTNELDVYLKNFVQLNYIEQYIYANFRHGKCFINDVKKKYKLPAQNNITNQLSLFIDLVSDLMFNFHMVLCLNLLSNIPIRNASNYAYIYSHRPTSKVLSGYRDQLKLLPEAIGHFAELDYVFGVPLGRNYSRIHRNVNMNFYNYSTDEENFSRQLIRYWSNFIKTGDPNKGSSSMDESNIEWKPYTNNEHNYLYFGLNSIQNELNYFDKMYQFWLRCFRIESKGGCRKKKFIKHLILFMTSLIFLSILLMMYFLWTYCQKKKPGHLFSHRSPTALYPYPNHVLA